MLDITFIRENPDIVRAALKNKNREGVDLDRILVLAEDRRKIAGEISELNRKRNEAADARDADAGKRLKDELKSAEDKYNALEKELLSLLIKIPNIPSADTPIGPDESGNVVVREWGEKRQFPFTPKAHWDIGKKLDVIDSEKAAEVSGARFTYLKGDLALMQFALLQFAFKVLTSEEELQKIAGEAGLAVNTKPFTPVVPPVFMRSQVMNRMARLDPIEDRFYFEKDDLVLVGSAEHTMGPLHMDEVIPESQLPIRYVGYSTAFRREAGSYGKDTKGILRQHQFDKLEMETFTKPEDGKLEQDFLVAIQENLMRKLNLPYRAVLICTGDMGFPDQRQIDLELWMPGQENPEGGLGRYRESHSADYVGGFQARRLNTKVKRDDGTTEPLHMNDATVIAVGRTLIAILENYQNDDGSVTIPEVLRPYIGKEKIDPPAR
ncbi:MAG TPA: serine--tRNA ligase [Candidatus Paceibacterota bacterium]|nr:serine--tRNA ligase [Candidatus Paceibacterota bacterium]